MIHFQPDMLCTLVAPTLTDGRRVILQGNNFTIVHTAREQPQTGSQLRVSVDLLESSFVHEGTGSPVSREQFMMVLAKLRVLHIRASYYSTVTGI